MVLIYGAGPIGALHALLAELKGAGKVIIAEKLPERIREIEKHTSARAVDLSNELSIDQSIIGTMNRSIKSPGTNGRINRMIWKASFRAKPAEQESTSS